MGEAWGGGGEKSLVQDAQQGGAPKARTSQESANKVWRETLMMLLLIPDSQNFLLSGPFIPPPPAPPPPLADPPPTCPLCSPTEELGFLEGVGCLQCHN